jgi:hypothetical protein
MDADADAQHRLRLSLRLRGADRSLRTTRVCADEFFNVPLEDYEEENGIYYAAITPFYLSYVSNDASYGGDLSRWPPNFVEYAKHVAGRADPAVADRQPDRS